MSPKWTVETIYQDKITDPEKLKHSNPFPPQFKYGVLDRLKVKADADLARLKADPEADIQPDPQYDDAFVAKVITESNWISTGDAQAPKDKDLRLIERRVMQCPLCHDTGYYWSPYKGEATQIEIMRQRGCSCPFWIARWSIWGDTSIIPLRFQDVTWEGLRPSDKSNMSMKHQETNIEILKANPNHNYLIYGEAGTGKTHYSIALLDRAVRRWAGKLLFGESGAVGDRSIFRVDTKTWCDEMLAWNTKGFDNEEIQLPGLNVSTIRNLSRHGVRIFVIFDELDKIPNSEGRLLNLFQITNALSECGAQMIATSNHTPSQLKTKWKSEHTEPILRRFMDGQGGEPRIGLHLTKNPNPPKKDPAKTGKT